MTCIVGLVQDGALWIGGDAAMGNGETISCGLRPKVFRRDVAVIGGAVVEPMLLGYTTSFRFGQLVEHGLTVPARPPERLPEAYMALEFVDALRAVLKDKGWAKVEHSREEVGTLVVAYAGAIWTLGSDLQATPVAEGYDACGSGYQVALGSLHTSSGRPAYDRVYAAMAAAAAISPHVRPPFTILSAGKAGSA